MTARKRPGPFALLLLAAGIGILLRRVLWKNEVIADRDILVFYYPVKTAIRGLFLRGESLLWNPMLGEGQPLAANPQHEIWYPFTWLLFFLPVRTALTFSELAHLAIAFLGMRRFLRVMRRSEAASLLGAVSWTFGGIFISTLSGFPIFFAWTWIPWLAAAAMAPDLSPRHCVRGAVFGTLVVLTGEPVSLLIALIVAASAFFSGRTTRSRLFGAGLAALLAFALTFSTWLPGAALAQKGTRAGGLAAEVAGQKSFPPARLAELVIPGATGSLATKDTRDYFGWRLYPEKAWPFFWGIYGGVLLLPLALAGLFLRPRAAAPIGLAGLLGLALSLGPSARLWTVLRSAVPPFRSVRFPEKFTALFVFSLTVLAALGFDALRRSPRKLRLTGLLLMGISLAIAAAFLLPGLWEPGIENRLIVQGVSRALRNAAPRYLLMGALLALLSSVPRRSRLGLAVVSALLIAAAADVLTVSRELIHSVPAAWMADPPPVIKRLAAAAPRLVDFLPIEPRLSIPGTDQQNSIYDRSRALFALPVQWGIPLALDTDFDRTYLAASVRARELLRRWGATDARVFSRLLASRHACALLVWNEPVTLADPVLPLAVPGCRPEVDSELFVRTFHGDEDFFTVTRPNPDLLPRTALLETTVPAGLPSSPVKARIANLHMRSTSLEFDASAPAPALIRIARTNDGNWAARIDGEPWPLFTVDLSLIGLSLPAGEHHVVVRYRDDLLLFAVSVSLASLVLLVVLRGLRGPGIAGPVHADKETSGTPRAPR
jgi:hypothetical protein